MMYRVGSDDLARRNGGKRDILAAIAGRPIARRDYQNANIANLLH
jgi:hypothetical protein